MAKITIVRVPSLFAKGALTLSAIPPIGIAYLAASLRNAGHAVTVVDSIGEAVRKVFPYPGTDLFVNGLSIDEILARVPQESKFIFVSLPFSHEWPLAKKVLTALKERFPACVLIAGGEHATALPEFCLGSCPAIDYCVLGEGDVTAVKLVSMLEEQRAVDGVAGIAFRDQQGTAVRTEARPRVVNIDELPRPAWDLIPIETYLSGGYSFGVNIGRTLPILASRGCPYDCTFCSNPQMWGCRWVVRSPEQVVSEMEDYQRIYRVENFDFYDLTAIVRKDWIMEMCQILIDKGLNLRWQLPSGTRSEALDAEATALLYESGCRNISYAPESGSERVLKQIRKKVNLDQMLQSMKGAVLNGINIKANIIFGFPDETLGDILKGYQFIAQMALAGVHDASVWTFCAYPGSVIFDEMRARGEIPEFTDEYFFSLLSYSDVKQAVSWNQRFSDRQLAVLRVLGLIVFYAVSFTMRPVRFFKILRNIKHRQPCSRLEMIIEKALFRHVTERESHESCA